MERARFLNRTVPAVLFVALVAACSANVGKKDEGVVQQSEEPAGPVHVKVLAFNDLHGHITGPSGSVKVQGHKVEAGGADHLAARVAQIKALHPHTIAVTAGDLVGASPLLSSLFHDEPTIESMNAMTLDVASVGNHEFDEGLDELERMQNGGCHPVDGCQDGDAFDGAKFPFLAANVTHQSTGETIFPGWLVREFDGVKVGFIGLTLEGTPSIVSPEGVKGLSFADEAETINAVVPKLREQGVETIVVLVHEGGYPTADETDVNQCPGISGPITELVAATDEAVDVFVTGHTHRAYICEMDGRLVTAAQSYGRLLTEIDLMIDRKTGDVVERKATNLVIDRQGDPHPQVASLIEKYQGIAAPLANQKIGAIATDLLRDANEDGESALGRLIADIQLEATKAAERGAAQIAFMNPGGIRDSLGLAPTADEGLGVVTYSEAHTVQPFGNSLVTMTLTGAQIKEVLEAQFADDDHVRILQVSKGFTYKWSSKAPKGQKVDPKSIKLNGKVVDPTASYRVTVNSFLSTGGDGFTIFERGTDRIGGPVDLEAMVVYFSQFSPVKAPAERRIVRVD